MFEISRSFLIFYFCIFIFIQILRIYNQTERKCVLTKTRKNPLDPNCANFTQFSVLLPEKCTDKILFSVSKEIAFLFAIQQEG